MIERESEGMTGGVELAEITEIGEEETKAKMVFGTGVGEIVRTHEREE
jgi:hypothetical protein